MKTNGKCMVAIQNKKGDFWQVALDDEGQEFVLSALTQYFGGEIKIIKNKIPIEFGVKDTSQEYVSGMTVN